MNGSPAATNCRLLMSADLHIGRASSRVPDTVRSEDVRAVTAWLRIVDLAIQEQVDVVCLAGDVADQENKFWEALGPLENGIARLAQAGIRTIAVSGNHDYDVLTRLSDQLPIEHFTLLGRGGTWERLTIEKAGKEVLHLDGWSFPRERVLDSPLDSYDLPVDPNVPILGIVHGDLDVADSPYAPLGLARLVGLSPQGWLLGHIHAPRLLVQEGRPWVLYAGSPQALDPGEKGLHGPWVVELTGSQLGEPAQLPLSSVRYDEHEIDLEGVASEAELETVLVDGIRQHTESVAKIAGAHLAHLNLRLRLVGSTAVSNRLQELTQPIIADLALTVGNASVHVERIHIETTPPIDLEQYAKTQSAPGVLARLLLDLDEANESDQLRAVMQRARPILDQVTRHRDFTQIKSATVSDQSIRCYLKTQARALLTQLVSQSL